MRLLYRVSSLAFVVLFVAAYTSQARAQSFIRNSDVSISAFGQSTSTVSGNGVTVKPTDSIGAQAAFRHSYHWWLGFEGSYNYARYSEHYSVTPFSIQNNMHEFGGSYLVSGTSLLGFRPFALAGVSAVVFSPTLNGGQNVSWQAKPGLNYSVGVSHALLSSHFGVRLQYRGVYYKAPDFNRSTLDTGSFRLTSEPMGGVYFKF